MKPLLIFPIGGIGRRFTEKGINTPKQLLKVDGDISCVKKTILSIVNIQDFNVAIYVSQPDVAIHIREVMEGIGVQFLIIEGENTTSPVKTLLKILLEVHQFTSPDVNIFVHTLDIDTPDNFIIDLDYPVSTYIFKANSLNYSYVDVKDGYVTELINSGIIKEYANAGIYGFGNMEIVKNYCKLLISRHEGETAETPLIDLYSFVLDKKIPIKALLVETIYIFGTPSEYSFCKNFIYPKKNIKNIYIVNDHSGMILKNKFKDALNNSRFIINDMGSDNILTNSDYSDYVNLVSTASNLESSYIFAFCSTGQGVNVALNKVPGIISALIYDKYSLKQAIEHTCANAFCFPENVWINKNLDFVVDYLEKFYFMGGRHQNRLLKVVNS